MACHFLRLVLLLVSLSLPAPSWAAHVPNNINNSCTKDSDCHDGYLCSKSKCLTACGGVGGLQFGCQDGYDCIDIVEDGCDPRVGRNCPGTCKKRMSNLLVGAPGDDCGTPGKDCPALRCACRLCPNGVDSFGCCNKCVVVTVDDEVTGVKECSGVVPESFCPARPAPNPLLGAPGDDCGTPGKDCPALRCSCRLCPNGVDSFGCCNKCVVTLDDRGEKSCSGVIPEEFCPPPPVDTDPCDKAMGFINERVCAAFHQYGCERDCGQDFCQTLYGLIRRPKAASNSVWIPASCRR